MAMSFDEGTLLERLFKASCEMRRSAEELEGEMRGRGSPQWLEDVIEGNLKMAALCDEAKFALERKGFEGEVDRELERVKAIALDHMMESFKRWIENPPVEELRGMVDELARGPGSVGVANEEGGEGGTDRVVSDERGSDEEEEEGSFDSEDWRKRDDQASA